MEKEEKICYLWDSRSQGLLLAVAWWIGIDLPSLGGRKKVGLVWACFSAQFFCFERRMQLQQFWKSHEMPHTVLSGGGCRRRGCLSCPRLMEAVAGQSSCLSQASQGVTKLRLGEWARRDSSLDSSLVQNGLLHMCHIWLHFQGVSCLGEEHFMVRGQATGSHTWGSTVSFLLFRGLPDLSSPAASSVLFLWLGSHRLQAHCHHSA